MPSRFNVPFFSRRHLIAPGRRTVSLTRPKDAAHATTTTWSIFSAQKRPVSHQAMKYFSQFGVENFGAVFVLPALSTPAEVRAQVAKGRGITGWIITETDGTRWQIQSCRTGLLEQDYWAAVNQLQTANEDIDAIPPDPIGGDPDPDPPGDPPTVTITAVAPDPRATAINTLTIVFDKPVTGFELADLTLKRDGGSNLLTGSQTLASLDGVTWTLGNLAALTATNGTYVLLLTASGSGIVDADDQEVSANASETWVMNSAILTAAITPVSPDPRNSAVSTIAITFSAAVASGFTLADLSLKRNGGSNLLTGSQTLTTSDNITWTLGNLSGITGTAGTYVLLLTASGSGIVDGSANPLAADASETWTTDLTSPTAVVTPVTNDPRTEPVSTILITFSEAVQLFTVDDLTLRRDSGSNLISASQTLATFDNITWTLGNLTGITTAVGTYVLTVVSGSGIKDLAGNGLSADATDSWVTVTPAAVALPTTDDRMEAGVYTTSQFLGAGSSGVPKPYPMRWAGILLSYDQATIDEDEVVSSGLPGGPTKLRTQLELFTDNSAGLPFIEISGTAFMTPTIYNAYRGLPASPTSAGRYQGRGLFPPCSAAMWDASYTSRIRTDFGEQPTNLEAYAYINLKNAGNRAWWAQKIIDHVTPYFNDYRKPNGDPYYRGLWMDEWADNIVDPGFGGDLAPFSGSPAPALQANEVWGPVRDQIRAQFGALLSANMTTNFAFTDADADAIVDNLDILYVEKPFNKFVFMLSANFPTFIGRMRRMWERNPTGFGILGQPGNSAGGVDGLYTSESVSCRECRVLAAANAPGSGMRITCATPHYLANTAMPYCRFHFLTGFGTENLTCVPVTETVFDVITTQLGTLTPTASSKVQFTHSDLEIQCGMMMIAARFAGRRKYVYYAPSYVPLVPYTWPGLYGVPAGDYVIDTTSAGKITRLHCNFTGGTQQPSRLVVLPQTERTAYWETL